MDKIKILSDTSILFIHYDMVDNAEIADITNVSIQIKCKLNTKLNYNIPTTIIYSTMYRKLAIHFQIC